MKPLIQTTFCLLLACGATLPGLAAEWGKRVEPGSPGEHGERQHAEAWGGDIRHFRARDLDRWQSGHWSHEPHENRDGWWWIVGTTWYWYPQPIYPYPDPYLPAPAAAIMPQHSGGASPEYWYYCADPAGYYPYVPQCDVNWQRMPATPP
jgi:hypothetical protein